MSTFGRPDNKRYRVVTYIVLGVIFVFLAILAVGTFRTAKESKEARDKATQLQQSFTAAGLRNLNVDQTVNVLGNDGGTICAAPNSGLARAQIAAALSTGAGGPGARPVYSSDDTDKVLTGMQEIIRIYCPEEMNAFVEYVNNLRHVKTTS